ncbi:hypothetical protein [Streptomyces sp. NPDC056817]|uniref:hypothetical protein n=1 Tax=Streptomyces sp. NPDC056817 TaxID=3345950 RepID=UPI0036CBDCD6
MTSYPSPTWVHPALLSAQCIVVDDSDEGGSPWLRRGTHLRVFPSSHVGYPICPFTVWRAGHASRLRPVLEGAGDFLSTGTGDYALVVGGWGSDGQLSVLDPGGRTSGRCTRSEAFVARVPLPGLRYRGAGPVAPAAYWDGWYTDSATGQVSLPGWLDDEPIDAIGAPLPVGAWWSGVDGRFRSADLQYRVSAGVRDTPLPYDASQPADAYGRARVMAAALEADVATAWGQTAGGLPPAAATFTRDLPGNEGASAVCDLTVGLWASSVDPASARWWGFGTTLPIEGIISQEIADCFAVAALFAFHPSERNGAHLKLAAHAQTDPMAHPLVDRLYEVHANQNLRERTTALMAAGHQVGCLWTIAVATPPPDTPGAPWVDAGAEHSAYNADATWMAALRVQGTGAGPIAVLRDPDVPLNVLIRPDEAWRQPLVAPRSESDWTAVTVTDSTCPPGPATWRIAAADQWGQWSPFITVTSSPPSIPHMPKPAVVIELSAAGPLPDDGSAASPGSVSIRAVLPEPPIAAPPIHSLTAVLSGAASPVVLARQDEGVWTGSASIAPTTPGSAVTVECTVTATDAAERTTTGSASLVVHDPRPFTASATSGLLLFSGERRTDGFAELDVRAPLPSNTPAGAAWRLYVTDEQVLDPAPAQDEPRWSRANRLREAVRAMPTRARMTQLADASVTPDGGDLRMRWKLSGSLETVQALQLVATAATGLEAPPHACGCFTVAVPLGDTPPAPTLTCELRDSTTVSLTVSVSYPGIRPGDDAPPAPIARRSGTRNTELRARIRRSATGTAPSTWPVLTALGLRPDNPPDHAAGWRWTTVFDDVLPVTTPAWSPLSYVCEVAWPDEPAWDPVAAPDFGTVRPTWTSAATAYPSSWSGPSTELTVLAPRPTVRLSPAFTANDEGTSSIVLLLPVTHPRARPWTLTAFSGKTLTTTVGPGPQLRLDGLDATVPARDWLIAVVTPDGTTLPMVSVEAP